MDASRAQHLPSCFQSHCRQGRGEAPRVLLASRNALLPGNRRVPEALALLFLKDAFGTQRLQRTFFPALLLARSHCD